MATLTKIASTVAGAVVTFAAAAAGGDTFVNDGVSTLSIKNDDSSSKTVTIASPTPCDFGSTHPLTIVVTAGTEQVVGPFPIVRFTRTVTITYSAVTSLTVAVTSH